MRAAGGGRLTDEQALDLGRTEVPPELADTGGVVSIGSGSVVGRHLGRGRTTSHERTHSLDHLWIDVVRDPLVVDPKAASGWAARTSPGVTIGWCTGMTGRSTVPAMTAPQRSAVDITGPHQPLPGGRLDARRPARVVGSARGRAATAVIVAGLAASLVMASPAVQAAEPLSSAGPAASGAPGQQGRVSWLFVLQAAGGRLSPEGDAWRLELTTDDRAVAFSDRPAREAATLPTETLVGLIGAMSDPPNATLLIEGHAGGGDAAIVVELTDATYDAASGRASFRARPIPLAPGADALTVHGRDGTSIAPTIYR